MVKMFENLVFYKIGHTKADMIRRRDERQHATRGVRRAAMVVRSLPKASFPAPDAGYRALQVGEIDLVDQGAVTEDPVVGVVVHRWPGTRSVWVIQRILELLIGATLSLNPAYFRGNGLLASRALPLHCKYDQAFLAR